MAGQQCSHEAARYLSPSVDILALSLVAVHGGSGRRQAAHWQGRRRGTGRGGGAALAARRRLGAGR